MLSPKSAELVEATLPAVGAAIDEITELFYERMFAEHPILLRDVFNRGNQANGTQRQALAGSIAAFASGLLAGQRPDAMLTRIAHKHVSVGVTPGQYAVVHKHLLAAIAEVLDVTPEIAAAWSEVYWLMADTLIGIERFLPQGQQEHRVIARFQETEDVVTFVVRPVDGPVPASQPGQYVSVQVPLADGARQIRQYSLSGRTDDALQFSVKRDGEVSNHLHDETPVGSTLLISQPAGDVTLKPGDGPVLLASAGIGCTPLIAMLAEPAFILVDPAMASGPVLRVTSTSGVIGTDALFDTRTVWAPSACASSSAPITNGVRPDAVTPTTRSFAVAVRRIWDAPEWSSTSSTARTSASGPPAWWATNQSAGAMNVGTSSAASSGASRPDGPAPT